MEELEKMFELFPEKECPNINTAFRKLHANLMFRSERAAVSISGGSDSDVMLDMIQALNPAKNYPFLTHWRSMKSHGVQTCVHEAARNSSRSLMRLSAFAQRASAFLREKA